jgi:predicted MPP superfamily phosphohydrolase
VKNKKILHLVGCCVFSMMLALTVYGTLIEPYALEVNHIVIKDALLEKILKDKVVVHLSDLHISKTGRREKQVLTILNELKPDIVFLTGDYVTWKGEYAPAVDFLSRLRAKTGVWAVMGDYDYSSPKKSCIFCHEEGNAKPSRQHAVRFLKDKLEQVHLPGGTLTVVGLDAEGGAPPNESDRFPRLDVRGPSIILSHSPLVFDSVPTDQNILVLAGDTHGGQIALPVPAWLMGLIGYEKNTRYNQGLFEKGKKKMFVSRGIGTSHVPIRLFRPPEVVVYHFTSKEMK